ncbi:MAG: YidC/Oxa1 family insertase periplasmic-domain containing protein, partial [Gemmatimonadales bacterium]|nr:YidC/Oxa1 family insertase periplasmic-domain containing protein [Gemmatimonadales bacterium]
MERRLLLAILLMVIVAVVPSLFMKPAPRRPAPGAAGVETPSAAPRQDAALSPAPGVPAAPAAVDRSTPQAAAALVIDTASLASPRSVYRVTSLGGAIDRAEFPGYRSFRGGRRGEVVNLVSPGDRVLLHRLVVGSDTVRMDSAMFALTRAGDRLSLSGSAGALTMALEYGRTPGRDYLLTVTGEVGGLEGRGAMLLIGLGAGFPNVEGDSVDNYRHYGVAVRRSRVENHPFTKLKPDTTTVVEGPFDWVAVKSKYFMGALLSRDSTHPAFGGALLTGGPRVGKFSTTAHTWVTMPVGPDGRFRYDVYLGPQEYRELHPLGRSL